jgi:ATP-dependent Lon protease
MSDSSNEYQVQLKTSHEDESKFPDHVVIIPIMNSPIFPGMIAPIILSEEKFTPELDENLDEVGLMSP